MLVSKKCARSDKTYNKNAHKYREDISDTERYINTIQGANKSKSQHPINFIKAKTFVVNVLPRYSKYVKQYQLQKSGIQVQFITNM